MHDVVNSEEKTCEAGEGKIEAHDDKESLIEVTNAGVCQEAMVTSLQYTNITHL